jgi:hypothetical protein
MVRANKSKSGATKTVLSTLVQSFSRVVTAPVKRIDNNVIDLTLSDNEEDKDNEVQRY